MTQRRAARTGVIGDSVRGQGTTQKRIGGLSILAALALTGCTTASPAANSSSSASSAASSSVMPTAYPTEEVTYQVPKQAEGELVRRVIKPRSGKTTYLNPAKAGVTYLVEVQCAAPAVGRRVIVAVAVKKKERYQGAMDCGLLPAAATMLTFSEGDTVSVTITSSDEDVSGWVRVVPADQ